jgi:hypothetical protein
MNRSWGLVFSLGDRVARIWSENAFRFYGKRKDSIIPASNGQLFAITG